MKLIGNLKRSGVGFASERSLEPRNVSEREVWVVVDVVRDDEVLGQDVWVVADGEPALVEATPLLPAPDEGAGDSMPPLHLHPPLARIPTCPAQPRRHPVQLNPLSGRLQGALGVPDDKVSRDLQGSDGEQGTG